MNHILSDKTHGKKIAIIENEFGDVGIDDALMAKNAKEQVEEEIIEMMNGCICCTVRQDLVVVLNKLAPEDEAGREEAGRHVHRDDWAWPIPRPWRRRSSWTMRSKSASGSTASSHSSTRSTSSSTSTRRSPRAQENEAVEQVAFADRMILNKTDLVTEDDLVRVEKRLKSMNSSAGIIRTERSAVSVDNILDIRAFDLKKTVEMDPEFLNTENEHEHDATVSSVSVVEKRPLDLDAIQRWFNYLLVNKGSDLYRMKGFLNVANAEERFMFKSCNMIFNALTEPWQADETRESRRVLSKNLDHDALKRGFEKCVHTPRSRKSCRVAEDA